MKICINAGHSSAPVYRRGFRQVDDLDECHEGQNNFRVYELLKKNLEEYEDVETTTARPSMDDDPSLSARGKAGAGADLQLHIHSNAGGGRGPVMLMRPDAPDDTVALATKIRDGICKKFDLPKRAHNFRTYDGVWKSSRGPGKSYYGAMRNSPIRENILVEMAFHDNDTEARLLRTRREDFADTITQAIADHYGLKKRAIPYHTTGRVNLRAGSGLSYPILRKIEAGTGILVHAITGKWASVTIGSDKGYLSTDYIKEGTSPVPEPVPDPTPEPPPEAPQDHLNGPYEADGTKLWFRSVAGSYDTRTAAEKTVEKLKTEGYAYAWLQAVKVEGQPWFRAHAGSHDRRGPAEAEVQKLISDGYKGAWLQAVHLPIKK